MWQKRTPLRRLNRTFAFLGANYLVKSHSTILDYGHRSCINFFTPCDRRFPRAKETFDQVNRRGRVLGRLFSVLPRFCNLSKASLSVAGIGLTRGGMIR
jgi:hypothetical protein